MGCVSRYKVESRKRAILNPIKAENPGT